MAAIPSQFGMAAFLSAEEVKKSGKNNADKNGRGKRKIEMKVLSMDGNIPWQTAQPRDFGGGQ